MASSQVKVTAPRLTAEHRREQILETAAHLFARKGFQGTTTREIAQHAQINEAILFRHFSTKEELYWTVIEHQCERGRGSELVTKYLNSDLPAEQVFVSIAQGLLDARQKDFTLGRLLLYSALEQHELSRRFFRTHIADFFEVLAGYIQRQIDAGKFRETDPMLAARGFWGMVVYHFLVQELFGGKQYREISNEEASRTLVDIWLGGMLKEEARVGASGVGQNRPDGAGCSSGSFARLAKSARRAQDDTKFETSFGNRRRGVTKTTENHGK